MEDIGITIETYVIFKVCECLTLFQGVKLLNEITRRYLYARLKPCSKGFINIELINIQAEL